MPGLRIAWPSHCRCRLSRIAPSDRGIVHMDWEVKNQAGEVVMTFTGMHLLRRRAAGGDG